MGERSTSFWRAGTGTRQHYSWMVRSCSLLSCCRNFCILCAVLDSRFAPTFVQRFFRRRALLCLTGKPVLGSTTFRFEGTRHHPVCAVAFAAYRVAIRSAEVHGTKPLYVCSPVFRRAPLSLPVHPDSWRFSGRPRRAAYRSQPVLCSSRCSGGWLSGTIYFRLHEFRGVLLPFSLARPFENPIGRDC